MIPLEPIWPAPPELDAFVASHPGAGPADFDRLDFQPAKAAVKARRNADQGGLCIYCERKLVPTAGHVEHIHPKAGPEGNPALTFTYSNLAHSCDGDAGGSPGQHCGHRKGHRPLPAPPGAGCNDPFLLMTDGTVTADPATALTRQRRHLLNSVQMNLLGLNEPALKREREQWVKTVQAVMAEDESMLAWFLSDKPFRHIMARL